MTTIARRRRSRWSAKLAAEDDLRQVADPADGPSAARFRWPASAHASRRLAARAGCHGRRRVLFDASVADNVRSAASSPTNGRDVFAELGLRDWLDGLPMASHPVGERARRCRWGAQLIALARAYLPTDLLVLDEATSASTGHRGPAPARHGEGDARRTTSHRAPAVTARAADEASLSTRARLQRGPRLLVTEPDSATAAHASWLAQTRCSPVRVSWCGSERVGQ